MTSPFGFRPFVVDSSIPSWDIDFSTLTQGELWQSLMHKDGLDIFALQYPDSITSLALPVLSKTGLPAPAIKAYGVLPSEQNSILAPCALSLNSNAFYIRAMLALGNPKQICLVWLRVSSFIAITVAKKSPLPFSSWGILSNALFDSQKRIGINALVRFEFTSDSMPPVITGIDEQATAYEGLKSIIETRTSKEKLQNDYCLALNADIKKLELGILNNDAESIAQAEELLSSSQYGGRLCFALAAQQQTLGNTFQAKELFIQSNQLLHPYGYSKALECQSILSKPFRDNHPDIMRQIERGERLRTLTAMHIEAKREPLHGNAILAYCLRGTHQPEEGLVAAETSLSLDPLQPDVLGHKWIFLTELARDNEALGVALHHVLTYPTDPVGSSNLVDSYLLTGELDRGLIASHRYAALTESAERALEYFFRAYEQSQAWKELAQIFYVALQNIHAPTPHTLCCFGETLTELEQFDQALTLFERALEIDSSASDIIMGYARALARAGKELEAAQFLQSVLSDKSRYDSLENGVFLLTMLAEIKRRTGQPEEALALFIKYIPEDLVDLSKRVGAFPALEYCESLVVLNRQQEALTLLERLKLEFPEDIYVNELLEIAKR